MMTGSGRASLNFDTCPLGQGALASCLLACLPRVVVELSRQHCIPLNVAGPTISLWVLAVRSLVSTCACGTACRTWTSRRMTGCSRKPTHVWASADGVHGRPLCRQALRGHGRRPGAQCSRQIHTSQSEEDAPTLAAPAPALIPPLIPPLQKLGKNLGWYKRKILILPNRQQCGWPGMASIGCAYGCNTWINMDPTGWWAGNVSAAPWHSCKFWGRSSRSCRCVCTLTHVLKHMEPRCFGGSPRPRITSVTAGVLCPLRRRAFGCARMWYTYLLTHAGAATGNHHALAFQGIPACSRCQGYQRAPASAFVCLQTRAVGGGRRRCSGSTASARAARMRACVPHA